MTLQLDAIANHIGCPLVKRTSSSNQQADLDGLEDEISAEDPGSAAPAPATYLPQATAPAVSADTSTAAVVVSDVEGTVLVHSSSNEELLS